MAYSQKLLDEITSYVGSLAKTIVPAGENEMMSLATEAVRVLHGEKMSEYN